MKQLMLESFTRFVQSKQLFTTNDQLLVACSGGVDSVVLCHLLHAGGYRFAIAHCNFKLRGEESDADQQFTEALAKRLDVAFYTTQFATQEIASTGKQSIQVVARDLRYHWFADVMQANGFDFLLTAHHADDSAETMLMNLFKGTGIAGLHGILPKRGKIARPLLFADKKALLQYAQENDLDWREDASNATDKYTRNFFRHQVIPLVETQVPRAADNLQHSIAALQETEMLYQQAVAMHTKQLLKKVGEELHLPVLKLQRTKPFRSVAYEIVQAFGFGRQHLTDFENLLTADTGKYIQSASHRILRNRKWLIISPVAALTNTVLTIEADDANVSFENGSLKIKTTTHTEIPVSPAIAAIDASLVTYPLLLRRWKTGDYFYPLGMPKKKKLARFFIDKKLSANDKEKVWVLESNRRIIWVIGHRIDDRFKIQPSTKSVLQITFHPSN